MKWMNETRKRPYCMDLIIAREIVCLALKEGYLNWSTFWRVQERMKSHRNSIYDGGLFEQSFVKSENISKPIEDWD